MTDLELLAKSAVLAQRVIEQMTAERDALLAENQIMLPKAQKYDRYMDADGTLDMTHASKTLGLPSAQALGKYLRHSLGWLFKTIKGVLPKAHTIKKGYMVAKLWVNDDNNASGTHGRITAKGFAYLTITSV